MASRKQNADPVLIHWLLPKKLGGIPMPGRSSALQNDLAVLQAAGVDVLITLTAEWAPPVAELQSVGIKSAHFGIEDFTPPTFQQAHEICAMIAENLAQGRCVLLHCKAGKGRTGTLLACYLVSRGQSAENAIKTCRGAYDQWIETDEQIAFLKAFATELTVKNTL